ncbi:hypothetical protein [Cetobacterium somerae]|uniref:Uncharacterized protein n=1 Tax=Cetobacterium somerae ATCC BAA-474 TaxID=1319815 RepID=U7VFF2_9FUSO|nr:hypothetical protein [Cetobacterium somerae]ERT69859.1 hypothetical protein HMPREF0202_00221 [Cetobacterium somerae ATCC BAA-474]
MKKLLVLILALLSCNILASELVHIPTTLPLLPEDYENQPNLLPAIPLIPALPSEESTTGGNGEEVKWKLEDSYTIHLDTKVKAVVPLEIITDVDIKALVVDNQQLTIPFELEMNKEPDKQNFYILNYSETEIDIDGDGILDTFIYSPKYINKKLVTDNYLFIDGKNITREGVHKKKVYITVELNERR